jgi:DNA-binding LacI/PurR family transcriptional regulator
MSRKAKYKKLSDSILSLIHKKRLKAGDRIESEKQLAEKFHVNHLTVRKALELLRVDSIIHKIPSRGNFVGRAPKSLLGTGLIGFIYPDDESFFHEILSKLETKMALSGYSPLVHISRHSPEREKNIIERFIALNVEGIIAVPNSECADIYKNLDLPVVFFDSYLEGVEIPYVITDDKEGAVMAVEHIVSMGHRKIAYVGALGDKTSELRKSAYLEVLERKGIKRTAKFCLEKEYSREWGYNAAGLLFSSIKMGTSPTAVFCGNDAIAAGMIDYLNLRNIGVPSQVSVIGFGNLNYSEFIGLSTVDQPRDRIADAVWKNLKNLFAGQVRTGATVISTSLIIRKTSTPILK